MHSWIAGLVIWDVLMAELHFLEDVAVKLDTADGAVLEVNFTDISFPAISVHLLASKRSSSSLFLSLSVP